MFYNYSQYQKLIDLKKTDQDRFIVYFDGASRGNPGKVAATNQRGLGFCFFNENGASVAEFAISANVGTNNTAEYMGLLYSLWTARLAGRPPSPGINKLTARGDSELVVKQIKGEYSVKSPMLLTYFLGCFDLRQLFTDFKIDHVVRELNKTADKLSNTGVDKWLKKEDYQTDYALFWPKNPDDSKSVSDNQEKKAAEQSDGSEYLQKRKLQEPPVAAAVRPKAQEKARIDSKSPKPAKKKFQKKLAASPVEPQVYALVIDSESSAQEPEKMKPKQRRTKAEPESSPAATTREEEKPKKKRSASPKKQTQQPESDEDKAPENRSPN